MSELEKAMKILAAQPATTPPRVSEQAGDPLRDLPDFDAKVQARAALDRQADERALPVGVCFSEARCDFYRADTGTSMGTEFYDKWRDRADDFPDRDNARAALAPQAAPEAPTAWIRKTDITELTDSEPETDGWTPLYASPVAAPEAPTYRALQALENPYNEKDHGPGWQIAAHAWDMAIISAMRIVGRPVPAPEAPASEQQLTAEQARAELMAMPLETVVGMVGGATTASARDWIEDFQHENGNYENACAKCSSLFMGHKRRVTCKACYSDTTASAVEVLASETYTVSKKLMETVWTALTHYSYQSTYSAPRIGGVLEGCPRGVVPTPRELTEWAEHALREIRKEIPAQGVATATAPSSTASASVDTLEFARMFGAVLQADRKRVKSGLAADPEWMAAYADLIAYIDGRTAGTAGGAPGLLAALRPFADAYAPEAARMAKHYTPEDVAKYGARWDANTITPAVTMGDFRRAYEVFAAAPSPQSPAGGKGGAA